MTIIQMFSYVTVVVTIATCVAGAPVQNQGDNVGLNNAVYTQPELAEALARTYEAIEWQRNHDEDKRSGENLSRNLDHIGGSNLLRNLDHIGGSNLLREIKSGLAGTRNLDAINGAHRLRQTRRGLDSLSGATFGESKRFEPRRIQNSPFKQDISRELMMNRVPSEGSAKRNFDEIDRTNFDSFVKRNFDEIDRSGFDNFVKRNLMDAYLASRQR